MEHISIHVNGKQVDYEDKSATEASVAVELDELDDQQTFTLPKKRRNTTLWKMIISGSVAVMLGGMLGLSALKMLPKVNTEQTERTAAVPIIEEQKNMSTSFSFFVIQAGVFQTKESANLIKETLTNKKIPFIEMENNPTRIFVGVSGNKESLQALQQQYKQKNVQTFIKNWTLNKEVEQSTYQKIEQLKPFMSVLLIASIQPLNEKNKKSLQEQHKLLAEIEVTDKTAAYVTKLTGTFTLFENSEDIRKRQEGLLSLLKEYTNLK